MPSPEYREEPCRTALNRVRGMPFDWSLNPYMGCAHRCTFCYVRAFEAMADRASGDAYGRSLRIKVNVAEVLRRELARASWKRATVAIGSATDPYQPAEGRYRLTRACLRELAAARTPVTIITRGPMVVRDIDVLTEVARHADLTVQFSIPTVDPVVWRRTEPGTAPPLQRLRALTRLVDAGIDTRVAMAPILPGLSDDDAGMEAVVRAARAAGATGIWAGALYLKPGTREHFLEALARDFPEQVDSYERWYADRAYVTREHADDIRDRLRRLRARHGIRDRRAKPILPEQQLSLLP